MFTHEELRDLAGRVRPRKYVVTEQVQQTVPVSHEEVRIEREPITEANVLELRSKLIGGKLRLDSWLAPYRRRSSGQALGKSQHDALGRFLSKRCLPPAGALPR